MISKRECVMLVSSEFFHWIRWILDTCPLLDTCPNLAVSSEKIHWTEALPVMECAIAGA